MDSAAVPVPGDWRCCDVEEALGRMRVLARAAAKMGLE